MIKKLKYLIYISTFLIVSISYSQNQIDHTTQLKINYSIESKLPLLMRPAKNMFPKESVLYLSNLGYREEANSKFMGSTIITTEIVNYAKQLQGGRIQMIKKDSIITDSVIIQTINIDTLTSIYIGEKRKNILGYDCENFIMKTDSVEINGFLTKKINATGFLIAGKNYGLPLEFEQITQKPKITMKYQVKNITNEPLDTTKFIMFPETIN